MQDAAHRAGFFGARTWQNNVRTAWAHVMDEMNVVAAGRGRTSWLWPSSEFARAGLGLHMAPDELVAEFLAPNMTWQRDWADWSCCSTGPARTVRNCPRR